MASDYTVIQPVRQQFGDDPGRGGDLYTEEEDLSYVESGEPFVGIEHDYTFDCPGVDRSQWAVLQYNALGISYRTNVMQVNSVPVAGAMYQTPSGPHVDDQGDVIFWATYSMLVSPETLLERGNILHIESSDEFGGDHDDFILDNIVIWFKLAEPLRRIPEGEVEGIDHALI
jgi:hypothetical protein